MKVTEHVEHLLRQGRKPKQLIELGFPKSVITRVRRQLREEKTGSKPRTQKGKAKGEGRRQSAVTPARETPLVQPEPGALESKVRELEGRVGVLEALEVNLENIETRLDGTFGLGLKHHFKCGCGASGFVALRIQCTKCGRETWWGWFPKE